MSPTLGHTRMHSHLVQSLLLDWADGVSSSVGIVRCARGAVRDGLSIPMLTRLANHGTVEYQNVFREFRKSVIERSGIEASVTPVNGKSIRHMILPSTVLKILNQRPSQMRLRLGADRQRLKEFWTNLFSTKEGMELKRLHPHLRNKTIAELSTRIPVRVHEDAGPYSNRVALTLAAGLAYWASARSWKRSTMPSGIDEAIRPKLFTPKLL